MGLVIVVDSHIVLSIELHCGPNSGCSEASGDTWRDIQSKVWSGRWTPLCGARQTGMESKKEMSSHAITFVCHAGLYTVLLFSFRDLTLEWSCITKSWRQCWNRYFISFFLGFWIRFSIEVFTISYFITPMRNTFKLQLNTEPETPMNISKYGQSLKYLTDLCFL